MPGSPSSILLLAAIPLLPPPCWERHGRSRPDMAAEDAEEASGLTTARGAGGRLLLLLLLLLPL